MKRILAMIMTLTMVFSLTSLSFGDEMFETPKDEPPFIFLLVDPPSYE